MPVILRNEETVLNELLSWANSKKNVRAVVMTSSRANPNASIDIFSDYDIELIVNRLDDFIQNEKWIFHFGEVIANIKEKNSKSLTRLVMYSDGVRIDFQIYALPEFKRQTKHSSLPLHWDIGYKVLLDKDQVAKMLPRPSQSKYNISPPTEKEFTILIRDFWWDTTYVAKSLWRDEIFYAKHIFQGLILSRYLLKVLGWHIGSKHNWLVNINKNGRWLKKYLDNEIWSQVEKTFADADIERNWKSLFAATSLFSLLAREIAMQMNYEYAFNLEKSILEYLKKIHQLEKKATNF